MLIVNADDWGRDQPTTDLIAECYERGVITSATAMVYMEDSARAADVSRQVSIPLGLHLNFAEKLSDPACPDDIRERQATLVEFLRERRYRRWALQPSLVDDVRAAILDQLRRFQEIYGNEPTHVDGHQHLHVWPTAILSRAIPARLPVRRSFTFEAGEKPLPNRLMRAAVNGLIDSRHPSTREFATVRMLKSFQTGGPACARLNRAHRLPVEVMVHPDRPDEYAFLTSAKWSQLLAQYPLGTYAELAPAD